MNSLLRHLDEASEMKRYFTDLIPLEEMTSMSGESLGSDMVWDGGQLHQKNSRNERAKHIVDVIEASAALRACKAKYPWLVLLLQRARAGEFSTNYPISTKLECVTEEEARIIGNNLMPALKSRKTARSGVNQWRDQNLAAEQLLDEFPWMEDLFVAIGEGVVKTAPWGMLWRVGVGATLR